MSSYMKPKEKPIWSYIVIIMKQAISTANCSSSMTIILAKKIIRAWIIFFLIPILTILNLSLANHFITVKDTLKPRIFAA